VTHFLSGIPAGAHASAGPRIAPILPAGVRCLANALMARQIMALAQGAHTVRLVVQSQRTLIGYQCGKGLPLTGLLDLATLHALHG
jgi:1,6-anhydro-N-acetylmuramate kinase